MKVIIFGATGMVGKGVLLECLDEARVERVLLVSRHPTDVSHLTPKLACVGGRGNAIPPKNRP